MIYLLIFAVALIIGFLLGEAVSDLRFRQEREALRQALIADSMSKRVKRIAEALRAIDACNHYHRIIAALKGENSRLNLTIFRYQQHYSNHQTEHGEN